MESFSGAELGKEFDLDFALEWGLLPFVRNEPEDAADILAAYVNTYLKEELQAEGLIRNVPPFVRFLSVAGQINGQALNVQNIAREAAVARSTVDTYFAVLSDTLLRNPSDRLWQGAALETLIYHELRVYNEVGRRHRPVFYYRTPAGVEIDFIIETAPKRPKSPPVVTAIEVKRSERWDRAWGKPMLDLAAAAGVKVDRMIGVYCGTRSYRFGAIQVFPVKDFVRALFAGEVF